MIALLLFACQSTDARHSAPAPPPAHGEAPAQPASAHSDASPDDGGVDDPAAAPDTAADPAVSGAQHSAPATEHAAQDSGAERAVPVQGGHDAEDHSAPALPAHREEEAPSEESPSPEASLQSARSTGEVLTGVLEDIGSLRPIVHFWRLLQPLLVGLGLGLGLKLLGRWARRQLPRLRDDLLLLELALTAAVVITTALAALGALQRSSPLLAGLTLLLVGGTALLLIAKALPGHLSGLWMVLTQTIRVGDAAQIDDVTGTITGIGLVKLSIRTDDGQVVLMPLSHLRRALLSIRAHDRSQSVEITLHADRQQRDAMCSALRECALLSPYREPGTPVTVQADARTEQIHIRLIVWSPQVTEAAAALLRQHAAAPRPPPGDAVTD